MMFSIVAYCEINVYLLLKIMCVFCIAACLKPLETFFQPGKRILDLSLVLRCLYFKSMKGAREIAQRVRNFPCMCLTPL